MAPRGGRFVFADKAGWAVAFQDPETGESQERRERNTGLFSLAQYLSYKKQGIKVFNLCFLCRSWIPSSQWLSRRKSCASENKPLQSRALDHSRPVMKRYKPGIV